MTTATLAPTPAKRQILIALCIVGSIVILLAITKAIQIWIASSQGNFGPPPEAVTSVVAAETSWPRTISAMGSINPEQGITVSAEEPGKVTRVAFESGAMVTKGDVLVELDTSIEDAKLAAAVAKAEKSRRVMERSQKLRTSNAVSQEVLDDAIAQSRQDDAEVSWLKATIAKKKISSPFSGRAGIRMVNVGHYLAAGTSVVPLYALNPMYVDFTVPQQDMGDVAVGEIIEVTVDAFPGEIFRGAVSAVNPQIDPSNRNVSVRGTIPNTNERLRPGMFAQVKLILPVEDKVIAIPSTSISYAPYGDSVFVIETMKNPKGEEYKGVRQQIVKLGRRIGEQIAILGGLKPGDEVVTSGPFKLHPGAAVLVNNAFSPGNSLAPKPSDT